MADGDAIYGPVVAALAGAIGWLGKRLYDAPRPAEFAAVLKERDDLRATVAAANAEAKRLYEAREVELRELRTQLDELHAALARAAPSERRRRPGAD